MGISPRDVSLIGPATATAAQARAYARRRHAARPEAVDAFITELWRLGDLTGYDPAVVFAQFCDETGTGTSVHWVSRLNPGGIGVTDDHDQGIGFASGIDAARAMVTHLSTYVRGYDPALWRYIALDPRYIEPLKQGWGGTVHVLADLGGGKWASNPRYAWQIAAHLDALRAITAINTDESPAAPLPASPRDDARPPGGIVSRPTPNWHQRTGGQLPVAIVYHVTDDLVLDHVQGWFQQSASRASAHFVVERDGTIFQFVSTAHAAWTNGDYRRWRTDIPWLVEAIRRCEAGERNLNDYTVNVEFMGKPGLLFTEPQVDRAIALTQYLLARYPSIRPLRGHLLRHADINSVDRSYCPGATFPLRRIILAVGGDPDRLR